MAVFALTIEKQVVYQGELHSFGNTYHYKTDVGQVFDDLDVATEVADAERRVTQNNVDFVGWRTWGPTDGTALANVIRASGDLAFSGNAIVNPSMYKEACVLCVIEIARSPVLNRRRWLRKFVRLGGSTAAAFADDVVSGAAPLPAAVQASFVSYMNNVKNAGGASGDAYGLCTEDGDGVPLGSVPEVRPYLFTRDIGR